MQLNLYMAEPMSSQGGRRRIPEGIENQRGWAVQTNDNCS